MFEGVWFGYLIIMVGGMLLSGLAAAWVRSSYAKYSKQQSMSGLTGAQAARSILDRNGLTDVRVEPVAGQLTDHYDPGAKVVRLSEGNFNKNSVAAVSIAAHEVGHAIQDASGYIPMRLRSGIFPIANLSAQFWPMLLLFGILLSAPLFIELAIIALAGYVAFHVVTLPVEFNASTRAYGQLTRYGILGHGEAGGTRRVLTAAAFTYIAAALTAVLTLVWLILATRQ